MTIRHLALALTLLLVIPGCQKTLPGSEIGTVYARMARPAIWRIVPDTQAESLGLLPGDLIVSYNNIAVTSVDQLWHAQAQAEPAGGTVKLVVLRDEQEVELDVRTGTLGVLPDAARYTSSLAVALEDILSHYGSVADYDWIAAALGETFTFTAVAGDCPMDWPGAIADDYLESLKSVFGLSFAAVYAADTIADTTAAADTMPARPQPGAVQAIRQELDRGATVLALGEWADDPVSKWGIVTRFDAGDSTLYGFSTGSAAEVPVTGAVEEALTARYAPTAGIEPDALLSLVLSHAVELGQAYEPGDWQSGIAAYDVWLAALDSVPFCPVCGGSSQTCFDALVWGMAANKESANGFLADMRDALPDEADVIDEIRGLNTTILAKLDGVVHSGITVGTIENQRKLARSVAEMQQDEMQLQALYQELLGELE